MADVLHHFAKAHKLIADGLVVLGQRQDVYKRQKYDLTRVGRYKINQKLGLDTSLDQRVMTAEDFLAALTLHSLR